MPAKTNKEEKNSRMRPALAPEARENQLINLAINLAEQQLRDGTASSQVISHFLKLGSSKERIEKEILNKQKDLISAKTDMIKASKDNENMYKKAIAAMMKYSGNLVESDEYDDLGDDENDE